MKLSMMALFAFMISLTEAQNQTNGSKPNCFALDSTNVCGQAYVGLPVLLPAYTSVADFNEKLARAFLNEDSIATEFETFFGCSKNNLAPLLSSIRFRLSFWCSREVSEAVKYGCSASGAPFRLCPDECNSSVKTTQAILNNQAVCKGNATQVQNTKGLINVMTAVCSLTTATQCSHGADLEKKYCGWANVQAAKTECAKPSSAGIDCCAQFKSA